MHEFVLDNDFEAWIKEGEKFTPADEWLARICDWHPWISVDPFEDGIFGLTSDNAQVVSVQPISGTITRMSLLKWWHELFISLLEVETCLVRDGFNFDF